MRALAAVLSRCTADRSVAISDDATRVSPVADLTSSVNGSGRPVLDRRVIAGLERLGEATGQDLLGELSVLFLADADERLVTLRRALQRDDAPAFAAAAHALGGSSANVGATELAILCGELSASGPVGAAERLDAVELELAAGLCRPRPVGSDVMKILVADDDATLGSSRRPRCAASATNATR